MPVILFRAKDFLEFFLRAFFFEVRQVEFYSLAIEFNNDTAVAWTGLFVKFGLI